ncbi:MAG: hypothetical protein J0J02_04075 [Thiobacillus sp.]|nr:hypothetical protein [Thiobacillus sp.]
MSKSLLEQLPEIVAKGRQQAEKILESIEGRHRVQLQTREIVLPAKDAVAQDWITRQNRQAQRDATATTCWRWRHCWRATSTPRACAARWT